MTKNILLLVASISIVLVFSEAATAQGKKAANQNDARIKALTDFIVDRLSHPQTYRYGRIDRDHGAPGMPPVSDIDYSEITQTKINSNRSCEITKYYHGKRELTGDSLKLINGQFSVDMKDISPSSIRQHYYHMNVYSSLMDGGNSQGRNYYYQNIEMRCISGNCIRASENNLSLVKDTLIIAINQLNNPDEAPDILKAFQELAGLCSGGGVSNPYR